MSAKRGVFVTILAALLAATTSAAIAAASRPAASGTRPPTPAVRAAASRSQLSAPRLQGVVLTSPRRGYGLFTATAAGGTRCQGGVGSTTDGGRRFTRPAVADAWRCDANAPASSLAADAGGDVFLYGPALYASHDHGRSWTQTRLGGQVLAISAAGRSVWAVVARCHGHGDQPDQCPLRLMVSANGGRSWQAARHQLPGATVPGFGRQPAGQAALVRTSATSAYALSGPQPNPQGRPSTARIWVTSNGGASWTRHRVPCGTDGLSAALAVAPDRTIFVACAGEPSAGSQGKSVTSSTDGGRTWTAPTPCRDDDCPPLSTGYLGQIAAPSGRTVFLAGARSSLLVSRDGGRAWRLVRPVIGDDGGGTGQVMFFGLDGVVFGYNGSHDELPAIWRTSDGGAHWRLIRPVVG